LAINDGQLTLGDGGKMKLDMDPFPVVIVELRDKKILVCTDQAQMIKPHNLEIGVWKENVLWKPAKRVEPT
jgi:hypothetical protein